MGKAGTHRPGHHLECQTSLANNHSLNGNHPKAKRDFRKEKGL